MEYTKRNVSEEKGALKKGIIPGERLISVEISKDTFQGRKGL